MDSVFFMEVPSLPGMLLGVLFERLHAGWHLHPLVPPAVVDRDLWRREIRVAESADRDADRIVVTLLAVEDRGAANRAEPETESRALVAGANVFRRGAGDLVWRSKAGERGEYASGALLARQAMADPDDARLALDFDAQLPAGAGSGSSH